MNIVCCERGLLRTWFVVTVLCNERVGNECGWVMNVVCYECGVLWSVVCYGLWCFMVCGVLWSVVCYGLWCVMVCGVLWSVVCYGLL